MKKNLELYIHIPFCVKKCAYCDFLSAPAAPETVRLYVEALKKEIRRGKPFCTPDWPDTDPGCYRIVSVFFGGGTPSLLTPEQIGEIMEEIRSRFVLAPDAEITMECNPGTTGKQRGCAERAAQKQRMSDRNLFSAETAHLRAYRACGINRLSFGLQSADNRELALLGRIHTWEDFLHSWHAAREAGFSNMNIDLMSALPGQTVHSWEHTLQSVLALEPEHISAYSLIIEEGTPFYERYHEDDLRREKGEKPFYLPTEEEERAMYERTEAMLQEHGLYRYEISNYARPGYACRHNTGYWRGVEYMGFGLGASSMLRTAERCRPETARLKNPESLACYLERGTAGSKAPVAVGSWCFLSRKDEMEEFMFLGLRLIRGVLEEEFQARFGVGMEEIYGSVIRRLREQGLLGQAEGRIFLTPGGLDLNNYAMAEFLLE